MCGIKLRLEGSGLVLMDRDEMDTAFEKYLTVV